MSAYIVVDGVAIEQHLFEGKASTMIRFHCQHDLIQRSAGLLRVRGRLIHGELTTVVINQVVE